MSITSLKKLTMFSVARDKPVMLEGLQSLGCMHLLPLGELPSNVENVASPRADAANKALRFLSDLPERRRQVLHDPGFDVEAFVTMTLDIKQQLRDTEDRRDVIKHRMALVEPWGEVLFPPLDSLAGYRLWFYQLPVKHLASISAVELPWQLVGKDNRYAYLVVLAQQEPPNDLLPVSRVHLGGKPLSVLAQELEHAELLLEELQAERHALTRYVYLLSKHLADAENSASLAHAQQQTLDHEAFVAVQGWVPEVAVIDVQAFADKHDFATVVEDPLPNEMPPTLIDQPDDMQAGADLTMFYQVPGYRSWDPTWLLVGSFCLFFAMIIADAGYGYVLLFGLALFWHRLGASKSLKAYRRLGLALALSTVLYGMLVGSYFGAGPPASSLLGSFHILDINDFSSMMRISIVIGVCHVGFANAMMAYVNRSKRSAYSHLGWIAALIGGLSVWLGGIGSVMAAFGIVLATAGAAAILIFASDRPINKPIDKALRVVDGIKRLGGAMNAFGDVLSYMRLFALGLASASLAVTFNDLAAQAHAALPGLGVLAAGLILLLGHTLNFGLGVMSGVIHGLRLNYIEFYNWGMSEEGSAFRRFARKEIQP